MWQRSVTSPLPLVKASMASLARVASRVNILWCVCQFQHGGCWTEFSQNLQSCSRSKSSTKWYLHLAAHFMYGHGQEWHSLHNVCCSSSQHAPLCLKCKVWVAETVGLDCFLLCKDFSGWLFSVRDSPAGPLNRSCVW